MKYSRLLFLVMFCLAGCVSSRYSRLRAAQESQLAALAAKFEAAKKENLDLKNEISLFKKNQDVDSKKFVRVLADFQKELAPDMVEQGVQVYLSGRGLAVVILAEKLFASATDNLSDEGKLLLDKIGALIARDFGANYIYIEAHADNQPLAVFEWKSDWDFSFARALSVLKYWTEKKRMDALKFSASGFGQYRPVETNDSKEGRRLNRRIEIIVSPDGLNSKLGSRG